MANPNNPLRQYFRRPAIYISLPSKGKYYPEGAIELTETGEIPVYPMTAIDEITSKTPDALFNGTAIAELIKSCIPAIKNPWAIPSSDLDTILVAIRVATNSNELDIESLCTECEETSKYGINLLGLLAEINTTEYEKEMKVGDLSIKFRPLDYKRVNQSNMDQFEVQRQIGQLESINDAEERTKKSNQLLQRLNEMNVNLIVDTIESVATPAEFITNKEFISEYIRECDRNTFNSIRTHVIDLRNASNIKPVKIKCVNCSHEYEQQIALNATDFFD